MASQLISRRVQKLWQQFEHHNLKGAPDLQKQEMQKAFYAGVLMGLNHIKQNIDDDTTEDQGADMFESIDQECRQFFEKLLEDNP